MTVRARSLRALGGVLVLAGCSQEPLLSALTQQQANEVLALLLSSNIGATKREAGKAGFVVSVPKADFPASVELLRRHDLPSRARVEIAQMFPSDALVQSPKAEQVRLISGVEQRLEQSLRAMPGVLSARMNLSYDVDGKTAGPVRHASALVVTERDVDASSTIIDVKRYIRNSLVDIAYGDITVIVSTIDDASRPVTVAGDLPRAPLRWLLPAGLGVLLAVLALGLGLARWWQTRASVAVQRVPLGLPGRREPTGGTAAIPGAVDDIA